MTTNDTRLPDARWHRPDPNYLRELLERANLSQRAAARLLGMDERTMRYYASGRTPLPYATQFCLEALAATGGAATKAAGPTAWHVATKRPLAKEDAGKLMVGIGAGGWILGLVETDDWGPKVRRLGWNETDGGWVDLAPLTAYALLDRPRPAADGDAEIMHQIDEVIARYKAAHNGERPGALRLGVRQIDALKAFVRRYGRGAEGLPNFESIPIVLAPAEDWLDAVEDELTAGWAGPAD